MLLKTRHLIVVAESGAERAEVAAWNANAAGHVFALLAPSEGAIALRSLGRQVEACREPINIHSRIADRSLALISNLSPTPFELDGRAYASVEGFWQGLRFASPADRDRVAALSGSAAKRAAADIDWSATVTYEGETAVVGTWAHWQLMHRACWAKFTQCGAARHALLSTGNRPLTHVMRRDSRTIPGVIMADIWMRVRKRLRR
jgi:predicted NAD-dependent protein-ADP-ribosyltransferase YbiA (DUF1768 family)